MPRGGARPNSGPKKKKITLPIEALPSSVTGVLPSVQRPTQETAPFTEISEDQLIAKLNELALAGNPLALKLALDMGERRAKVELLHAQTRNLKLRNRALSVHLDKKGIELGEDEFEPEEDPVQARRPGLKAVGE
jgi:hypothetical protein